jgi:FtsH-binding integral membrane protein
MGMDLARPGRRLATVAVVAALALIAFGLLYVFSAQLGEQAVLAISDVGDVLAVGLCVALCFLLWRAFDRRDLLKQIWLYLGVGLGLWTLAEIVYAVYDLTPSAGTPYQSLADLLWVPGFVPIIAALWLRYRSLRVRPSRPQVAGITAAFVVLAGLSISFVVIPNLPEAPPGQVVAHALRPSSPEASAEALSTLGDMVLGVLYALGDLLLVAILGLNIMALLGGQLSRSWMLVAVGCLISAVADNLFYSGGAAGLYSSAVPVNLFTSVCDISYFGGYVVMAVGLYDHALLQQAL